jgi:molybdenum cofactor cytidylyltransferase
VRGSGGREASRAATRTGPVAALVLAAGASSRLGAPKQLLTRDDGVPLVRHVVDAAHAAGCAPVVVAIGAESSRVADALLGAGAAILRVPDWGDGMGASLAAAARHVGRIAPDVAGVAVLACDQPALDASVIARLVDAWRAGDALVAASAYAGIRGIPAVFDASLRPRLEALVGDAGARALLRDGDVTVSEVPWPDGALDLDTPSDVRRWRGGA